MPVVDEREKVAGVLRLHQASLNRINNDIYRRVVRLCLGEMAESGMGAPPVAFDVVVMGSGGRAASFLRPDQDNGSVVEVYPPQDHDRIDGWCAVCLTTTRKTI